MTTIQINICYGRATETDIARARHAAESTLAGLDIAAAQAEYERQWEERGDADLLTDLAAMWRDAEMAANLALTDGWHNPDGAGCDIEAV
jgi:hypothetical protein